MSSTEYNIFPLGDSALTIEFGNLIDFRLNELAIGLSKAIYKQPFKGFVECVPAYSTVSIFYDQTICRSIGISGETAFDAVSRIVADLLPDIANEKSEKTEPIEIAVDFSIKAGPDLEFVAAANGLDREQVIEIFTSDTYHVFMLGFLPGFPYMGRLDPRIASPRLKNPRMKVPKGSVGIAGRQTGIYPLESPGGWQLIGKTETEIFFSEDENPTLFSPGDRVNFVRV